MQGSVSTKLIRCATGEMLGGTPVPSSVCELLVWQRNLVYVGPSRRCCSPHCVCVVHVSNWIGQKFSKWQFKAMKSHIEYIFTSIRTFEWHCMPTSSMQHERHIEATGEHQFVKFRIHYIYKTHGSITMLYLWIHLSLHKCFCLLPYHIWI